MDPDPQHGILDLKKLLYLQMVIFKAMMEKTLFRSPVLINVKCFYRFVHWLKINFSFLQQLGSKVFLLLQYCFVLYTFFVLIDFIQQTFKIVILKLYRFISEYNFKSGILEQENRPINVKLNDVSVCSINAQIPSRAATINKNLFAVDRMKVLRV